MIIHFNNTSLDIEVDDTSYRERGVKRINQLTLYFSLPNKIDIPVGAWCEFQGQRYELYKAENFQQLGYRNYSYTLILEGDEGKLKKYMCINQVDRRLKFDFTAKPEEIAKLIVDNLNKRESGWSVGTCVTLAEKCLNIKHNRLEEVCGMVEELFGVEVWLSGKTVNIGKLEVNKDYPISLSIGSGLKEGPKRESVTESNFVEILYVNGGDRNIDYSKYGSKELLLPKNQTIVYNGRMYVTDSDGYSVRRSDRQLTSYVEDSIDLSSIYPKREGTVSGVVVVNSESNLYDIIDSSIPESLNYGNYRISGETATIMFLSGMLSQRTFDIEQTSDMLNGYVHSERRFKLVPADQDGVTMPNDTFTPKIGDKYAVFGISMPDEYVCDNASQSGASWEMLKEAVKYLYENESLKFNIIAEVDGIWTKKDWVNRGGKLVVGGYVTIADISLNPGGDLTRIVTVKDYINNPHSPTIEITNSTTSGSFTSKLNQMKAQDIAIDSAKKDSISFTKRRFRDAQETSSMIEKAVSNFSGSINPATVNAMQLLIGDESLQYRFVTSKTNPQVALHNMYYDESNDLFRCDSGILQHMTYGITVAKPSRPASEYMYWDIVSFVSPPLTDEESYYIYIKCNLTSLTGEFVMTSTPIAMNSIAGYIHLWAGVLNSKYNGTRSFVKMYGYTEVTPGRITAEVFASPDGSKYIDLINGIFKGKFEFSSGTTGLSNIEEWPAEKQEIVDKASTFETKIISSNGDEFQNGDIDTTLTALVFRGSEDITSTLNLSCFRWVRKSKDAAADSIWNQQHATFYSNVINITTADVYGKAVFNCIVTIPTT